MGILPSCSHVNITVWLLHWDLNETLGEEARWELHKDVVNHFEQILKAGPHKTAAIWLLTSHRSWRQHPTKQQLYGHLPPITKTIQIRRTRYAGHCWRSRDKLISDVLLWTPSHGRAKTG